jgi:hypothetical protein
MPSGNPAKGWILRRAVMGWEDRSSVVVRSNRPSTCCQNGHGRARGVASSDPEFNAFIERLKRTTAMLEAAMRESARLTRQAKDDDRRAA